MTITLFMLTACFGSKKVTDIYTYTPEESGLNMVKLTDESKNTVYSPIPVGGRIGSSAPRLSHGYCKKAKYGWTGMRTLSVSPDGTMLAYVSNVNDQKNVMIRRAGTQSAATQRTFRDVADFSWGPDNRLYFADLSSSNLTNTSYICSVNAESGSLMTQITNGSVYDKNPITADGKIVYFTRNNEKEGPFIWSLNLEDGTLTSCARGFMPCPIPGESDAFYCVRNSSKGRSEIWYVNYEKGQETMLVSDENHSYTNPSLSPDGRWIVMQGNSISSKNKKDNLDIYVMRTDGSMVSQITYSPSTDTCPVFSPDGKYIYFLSDRGNKDEYFNVWRMTFRMD